MQKTRICFCFFGWKRWLWWECFFWTSAFLLWVQTCFLSVNYSSWCSTSIFSPHRNCFWFYCVLTRPMLFHMDWMCGASCRFLKYVWPDSPISQSTFWRSTRQQSRAWGLYHWSCDPFEVGNPKNVVIKRVGFLGNSQKQPGFKNLENRKVVVSQVYDVLKKYSGLKFN